jgi:hypothetical protein
MDELAKAGRLHNSREQKERHGMDEAQKLMKDGYCAFINWIEDGVCLIPSTQDANVKYKVDIIRATCECHVSSKGGMYIFSYIKYIYNESIWFAGKLS